MITKIQNLKKEHIPACLKIILDTEISSNKREAKKILELSLVPGIKPLNPNYYILTQDKKIIGISGLYYDYEDPKDIMWMDYFAITPKLQKQGFGSKMLENLEAVCKKKKVKMLCVFTDSQGALKFYKKKGFKVSGKIGDYYAKGKPRIWLFKLL